MKTMDLMPQLSTYLSMLNYEDLAQQAIKKEKLLCYLQLIEKWNKVHNLTSIRKPATMLTHHIMDSLAVLPEIIGQQIVDVGSGAGLPGIPVAIAKPEWQVTLIESNQKKTVFLQQVKIELQLSNLKVISQRVEHVKTEQLFNTVISRALSSLNDFVKLSGHLCQSGCLNSRMMAMKSDCFDDIVEEYSEQYKIEKNILICVPGLDAKRHLIVIRKV